jgi:hypothetical protein
MQNFYIILDYENYRFAMNGIFTATGDIKPFGFKDNNSTTPNGPAGGSSIVWAVIGSIIGVLAVVAIVGFIIVRMKNSRLQANLAKYEQL